MRPSRNPKAGLAAIDVVVAGSHVAGDLPRIHRQRQSPSILVLSTILRVPAGDSEKGSTVQVYRPVVTMTIAHGRATEAETATIAHGLATETVTIAHGLVAETVTIAHG
ncbi:MAG: hypothetical protein WCI02_06405, partial [Planctomycetota bacterium]